MKKIWKSILRIAPDAAVLLGAAAITAGAALLSAAAGLITGGVLLAVIGIFGGGGKHEPEQ